MAEHVALYPPRLPRDRYHPRRGEPGIPTLVGNPRAFAQATWRHALFGVVLGRLAVPGSALREGRERGAGGGKSSLPGELQPAAPTVPFYFRRLADVANLLQGRPCSKA